MQLVRRFLKLFLCVTVVLGTWPVQAQDVKDLLIVQQERIDTLETKLDLLEDMLADIIANNAADRLVQALSDPEKAKADVEARKPDVDTSIAAVTAIPAGQLPEGLKPRIETCLTKIKEATGKLDPDAGANIAAACSPEEAESIKAELDKARDDAVKTWKACRDTLQAVQNVGPISLPTDPSGLSGQGIAATKAEIERLTTLVKDNAGGAEDCVHGIKDTFEKVRSIETAAAAMSAALSVAAAICAATAGTGCAVMAAIAMILKLFDRSGGGGGTGKSKGPDRGGNIPGNDAGKCTANCSPKPQQAEQPVGPPAGPICGPQGCVKGNGGPFECGFVSATAVDCARTGTAAPKIRIDSTKGTILETDAEKELAAAIVAKDFTGLFICTGADPNFIKGIILKSSQAGKSYLIGMDYQEAGNPMLVYPPTEETIASPPEAERAKACDSIQ